MNSPKLGASLLLTDNVVVIGYETISREAHVSGFATIFLCEVEGGVYVYGAAKLMGGIVIGSGVSIFGKATSFNNLVSPHGIVLLAGCKFSGNADFGGLYSPESFIKKYGEDHVKVTEDKVILTDMWDMG